MRRTYVTSLSFWRKLLVFAVIALITAAASVGIRNTASANPTGCAVQVTNATSGATVCFTTIQAGINFASPDDTVSVNPGTYNENITIPKRITVNSWGGAGVTTIVGSVTHASTTNAVVNIVSDGVTFGGLAMGFTVQNSPITGLSQASDIRGIAIGDGTGNTDVRVLGNIVSNLVPSGLLITTTPSVATTGKVMGISATKSPNVMISNNEIRDISFTGAPNSNPACSVPATPCALTGFGIQLLSIPGPPKPNSGAVDGNKIRNLQETGGTCPGTVLIGVAINDNSAATFVSRNIVSNNNTTCRAVGFGTSAVPGPITFSRNFVDSLVGGVSSEGFGMKPGANPNFTGAATDTLISNDIRSVLKAVAASVGTGSSLTADSIVEYNNFNNDTYGVDNGGVTNLIATNNWWGCAGGPFGGTGCATIFPGTGFTTLYQPFLATKVPTFTTYP